MEKVLEVLFPGPVGCVGRTREVHGSGCGAGEISMAFLWVPMRSSLGVSQEVGIAVIGICNKKQKRDQCGLGDRNCSPPLRLQWSFKLSHLLQEGEELHSLSAISHQPCCIPPPCPVSMCFPAVHKSGGELPLFFQHPGSSRVRSAQWIVHVVWRPAVTTTIQKK